MSNRIFAGVLAVGVAFAAGPALAWEPAPGNDANAWTTITTIAEIGSVRGQTYVVVAEPLPANCPSFAPAYGRQFRDDWLGIMSGVAMGGANAGTVAQFLSIALFARAQNARVRITLGGAEPNSGGCAITGISTCFDDNKCTLPPVLP